MRNSPTRILAVATTLLLATACTGGAPSSSGDDANQSGPQTLEWLIEEPEDAEALQALEDHIADFEEESGHTVNLQTLPFDAMRTVLQTQLRSGEGPDVFNWGSGPSFGGALAEAGLVYDLTEAYEEHDWDVYDFAVERVTRDGAIYGIPGEMETIGLFYNEEIFSELGLEAPQDLSELEEAAQAIKDAGYVPMAVGDQEGWEGGHYLSMSLSSRIGSDGMEELLNGERSWDSPEIVESLQMWKDFQEAGYLTESPTSVDYDTSISQFFSGDAAMIPTGSWLVGEIDDNTDFGVSYVPFPAPDGPGIFTGGLGSGPYISAGTNKVDAAIEFLDFLASEEHGRWTVETLHTIPPQPIDTSGLEISPLLEQVVEDTAAFSEGSGLGHNIDVMVSDQFNEAMYDGVQGIFTNQSTPEEVAGSLDAAFAQ